MVHLGPASIKLQARRRNTHHSIGSNKTLRANDKIMDRPAKLLMTVPRTIRANDHVEAGFGPRPGPTTCRMTAAGDGQTTHVCAGDLLFGRVRARLRTVLRGRLCGDWNGEGGDNEKHLLHGRTLRVLGCPLITGMRGYIRRSTARFNSDRHFDATGRHREILATCTRAPRFNPAFRM